MLDYLLELDRTLLLVLNDMHSAFMDDYMMLFSGRWVWVPMYVAIFGAVVWRYGWRRGILLALSVGAAVAIANQTCATLLRPLAERLRPANLDNPLSAYVHIVDGYRGGQYGFPSCHAANTFALAASLCILFRSKGVIAFIYLWALVTCYSRVYLGVHYPGDIIVGAVVGTLASFIAVYTTWRCTRNMTAVATCERWHRLTPTRLVILSGSATIVILAVVALF